MALYLRNKVWWMEIRTSKIRIRKSTGFGFYERDKAEKLFKGVLRYVHFKSHKQRVDSIVSDIYGEEHVTLDRIFHELEFNMDWAKTMRRKSWVKKVNRVKAMFKWCSEIGLMYIDDITNDIACQYICSLDDLSNKTRYLCAMDLHSVWDKVVNRITDIPNPWCSICSLLRTTLKEDV